MSKYDYVSKYTDTNFATRLLINRFYKHLKRHVDAINASSILEVGCGPGVSTQYLRSFLGERAKLKAVDLEQDMVEMCKARNPGVEVSQQSIYELKYADGEFDSVVCLEVLEHVENPEQALNELRRVAKKSLVVSVPNEPLWRVLNVMRGRYLKDLGNTPGHIQHWSPLAFRKLLAKHGEVRRVSLPIPWTMVSVAIH